MTSQHRHGHAAPTPSSNSKTAFANALGKYPSAQPYRRMRNQLAQKPYRAAKK